MRLPVSFLRSYNSCMSWLNAILCFICCILQQALVGEGLGEEQLFSSGTSSFRDGIGSELDGYQQKLKVPFLSLSLMFCC